MKTSHALIYFRASSVVSLVILAPFGLACGLVESNLLPARSDATINPRYGTLPVSFEPNRGQANPEVDFLARSDGYELFLTPSETVLLLQKRSRQTAKRASESAVASALRMKLVKASPASPASGLDQLPGKKNYLIGSDRARWHRDIPTYGKVQYQNVYRGVDIVYYGNQRHLEYDFIVAPGTDPSVINLQFDGQEDLFVNQEGELVLTLVTGEVRFHKPLAYQRNATSKRPVAASYIVSEDCNVSFRVGGYDRRESLVIDPILSYSTFIGGSSGEGANAIAVDKAGNTYIVGHTFSANYPITPNAFIPTPTRAFVTKLNQDGSALVYSTFFGAVDQIPTDEAVAIAVDAAGHAYVTGNTSSVNFPTTSNAYDRTCGTDGTCNGNKTDAFLSVFNTTGSDLIYSTYFGGSDLDAADAITLDGAGKAYLAGTTFSNDLPIRSAAQPTCGGGSFLPCVDAFVAKFDIGLPGVSGLVYSTYLGGNGDDRAGGIAVDSNGNAYTTGQTLSTNFPTSVGAFDTTCGDDGLCDDINSVSPGPDAFVTKLNPSGNARIYSTYLGANGYDIGNSIALDSAANAYVTGLTQSTDFPVTAGAFGPRLRGIEDAFVTIVNSTGNQLRASTYLGSNGEDIGVSVALDAAGNIYVAGTTDFDDFPVTPNRIFEFRGGEDAFVTKFSRSLGVLIYSTYLGGSEDDLATGLALSSAANSSPSFTTGQRLKPVYTYVTGTTHSPDFPTTPGAFDRTCGTDGICNDDRNDVFVTRLQLPDTAILFAAAQVSNDFLVFSTHVGTTTPRQTVTLTSLGTAPLLINSITVDGDFAQTNNCGSSLAPGAQCQINVTFTPSHPGIQINQVMINDNAADSPQIIHLHGTGISNASASLSPGNINFGNQPIGIPSSPRIETITSTGSSDLIITSVWVGPPFSQTNNCLDHPLHPGDTCTVNIVYTPLQTGGDYTIFQLQDNTPNFNAAAITGNGVP